MLNVGRDKLRDNGIVGNVHYVQANAEELPFPDDYFDVITISFCLRNVTALPVPDSPSIKTEARDGAN